MYETPALYLTIHILIGALSYFYPPLFALFTAYQILQWALDARFFLFSWQIKRGNSFLYTLYKIMQGAVGYYLTYVLQPHLRFGI
jgi:hypothetical protein